jgi:multidrug resistance efflux pump
MKHHHHAILLLGLIVLGSAGCEYLPEAITGRPDPNAPKIAVLNPNESEALNQASSFESNNPAPDWAPSLPTSASLTSTSSTVAGENSTSSEPVVPTSGSSTDDAFFAALSSMRNGETAVASGQPTNVDNPPVTFPEGAPPTGIAVPAANMSQPSNGNLMVRSAFLQFVYDSPISAPTDGVIFALKVEEGGFLQKDEIIVQIDDRLAQAELNVSTEEHNAAVEKSMDTSEIKFAQAGLDVAKAEWRMQAEVNDRGAGSESETLKKQLELSRSQLAVPVAELKNKQDKSAARVAEAKKGAAAVQLDLRKVKAPFDGMVSEKLKNQFEWVRAGDPILKLTSMDQVRVVGHIEMKDMRIAPHELFGKRGRIGITLFPGRVVQAEGTVGYVSPTIESGRFKVWLQIPNEKSNGLWIYRAGMPASIEILMN